MVKNKRFLIILILALLVMSLLPVNTRAAPIKTPFSGTDQYLYDTVPGEEYITDDGIYHIRNNEFLSLITTTDPRINGEFMYVFNGDFQFMPEPVFVMGYMWGTFKVENAGGYWEGTITGYRDEFGSSRFSYIGTGGGGYAGLRFKMFYKRLEADPSVIAFVSGAIIEAEN